MRISPWQFLIVVIVIFFQLIEAHAVSVTVVDRFGQSVVDNSLALGAGRTVGAVTVEFLKRAKDRGLIQSYDASEVGVLSINGLGNDLELLSDTELRAWGWCFTLNGTVSETMPDATPVNSDDDKIVWYYGYAHYKAGEWLGQCLGVPTGK